MSTEKVCSFAEVLSNIISSQIEIHKQYGGVMPELASRLHLENIMVCIKTLKVQILYFQGADFSLTESFTFFLGGMRKSKSDVQYT